MRNLSQPAETPVAGHIEYMRLDIAELKAGVKDLRTELESEIGGKPRTEAATSA